MKSRHVYGRSALAALWVAVLGLGCQTTAVDGPTNGDTADTATPRFEVDPFWPKPLPNDWLLGRVGGMAIDSSDHVWVLQRPGSLTADELGAAQDPPLSMCCKPAPSVLRFDPDGHLVGAWGGPGDGYDWPSVEHGLFVDHNDNVWVGGEGPDDHQVLKFTSDGEFLLQIGVSGKTGGGNHREYLGHPADLEVYAGTTLTACALLCAASAGAQSGAVTAVTVIRAGQLVDPATGTTTSGQTIVIEDGKIASVGAGASVPEGAVGIDLSTSTVLPGLIDSHTHLATSYTFPTSNLKQRWLPI